MLDIFFDNCGLFNEAGYEEFETIFAYIPTEFKEEIDVSITKIRRLSNDII